MYFVEDNASDTVESSVSRGLSLHLYKSRQIPKMYNFSITREQVVELQEFMYCHSMYRLVLIPNFFF